MIVQKVTWNRKVPDTSILLLSCKFAHRIGTIVSHKSLSLSVSVTLCYKHTHCGHLVISKYVLHISFSLIIEKVQYCMHAIN